MLVVGEEAEAEAALLDLNWWLVGKTFLLCLCLCLSLSLSLLFKLNNKYSLFSMLMRTKQQQQTTYPNITYSFCVVCGKSSTKQCSACKSPKYCSTACQSSHWNSGHKTECKKFQLSEKCKSKHSTSVQSGRKSLKNVSLVAGGVLSSKNKRPKEILFPYEDFVELYNWDKAKFPPCGILNCGNSCFANVVLQCLSCTKPLVAYLLEKGHRKECRRNDWCFLCEFQTHIERASSSRQPFSPLNILSRLPNIGGNLGYGKQEDAHEFMRFAIDTMQSVFLDEFGGEEVVHPSSQDTTLIQHIFGGHLQSQVVCSVCRNVSNQCENVMDLTVEINGDATSLEECLDQFTAKEQLHGDNLYKCDGCNDYVMAWKRLMIRRAPNILTIALKRFQSGRFGKLNKRITLPETLDLSPYMTEERDGNDIYKLYAVVVHVDMLNASFFGHYICYTKDYYGNWYRIDDCLHTISARRCGIVDPIYSFLIVLSVSKVSKVDLQDVLSEGAYMLMYNRICPRPSCLKPIGSSSRKEQQTVELVQEEEKLVESAAVEFTSHSFSTYVSAKAKPIVSVEVDLLSKTRNSNDVEIADSISNLSSPEDMDVSSFQDTNPEREMGSSSLCTKVENQQRVEASNNTLFFSYTENSQCSGDCGRVEIEQNHDNSSCQDFISSPSSPQGIVVSSCEDLKSENVIDVSAISDEFEISNDVLMSSSTENSQCSEDSERVNNEQKHEHVNNLPHSANSKREGDSIEMRKGKIAARKSVNGTKLKPFLNPGFLVKQPSNNLTERRG